MNSYFYQNMFNCFMWSCVPLLDWRWAIKIWKANATRGVYSLWNDHKRAANHFSWPAARALFALSSGVVFSRSLHTTHPFCKAVGSYASVIPPWENNGQDSEPVRSCKRWRRLVRKLHQKKKKKKKVSQRVKEEGKIEQLWKHVFDFAPRQECEAGSSCLEFSKLTRSPCLGLWPRAVHSGGISPGSASSSDLRLQTYIIRAL